ncbi:hypothetical protein Aspvir_009918 [Aspergillus viridinutans]|uniref:Uncharacterized protein n=1 Tax=Aspergillus viridinutans TaxID=75553 RepID=A0A9P3C0U6_ASPVI|nr:uncharacterized protein Aspvir_009918 [Aspergillus viridinutans]GIK05805.1 hypothetical protein Aspvir_009918 [Aspergillus viridinutans]
MALEAFSVACNAIIEAEQLSQLVSQQEFIECLRKLWKKLPKTTKDKINKSHPRPRHRKITQSKIVIPAEDQANIAKWLQNRNQFFDDDDDDDDDDDREIARHCQISRAYRAVVQAELRHSKDNLRLRFFKVLFFHLKVRSGVQNFRDNTVDGIARVIGSAINIDIDQIARNITSWAKIGKKYDGLCQDLAKQSPSEPSGSEDQSTFEGSDAGDYKDYMYLGPLFYLPSDVTERWLKDLTQRGQLRDRKIKMFIDRGIFEVDNKGAIDTLVGRLFCGVWVEMEKVMKRHCLLTIEKNHSLHTIYEWRTQKPMPAFQVRGACVRDIVSPSSASAMSTDEESDISEPSQCVLSDTLVTAQPRASSLIIGQSPEQQASPYEDLVLPSTSTGPIDGGSIVSDTGTRALSGTLVVSSAHSSSPTTGGSPEQQASSYEDLPSSTSPIDEGSIDEGSIVSDTGTRALSGTLSVSPAHSSPPGFVYQDAPQVTTWDFDASLEAAYPPYNSSDIACSSGHLPHDPDFSADRSMFNLEQYGWDGFHHFDVDQYGQPGYHYFDPTLFGVESIPVENTMRGISHPDHYSWGGFHHFDIDEYGQPGYHYFDPALFGLAAMQNEQPAVAGIAITMSLKSAGLPGLSILWAITHTFVHTTVSFSDVL